ncbi:hydrogenase expression/formation protein HupK [Rhodobacter sp. NTK016B]|uniref:hydrogenase expression/formation protein HupK n=1 Tax=Rhodobacter sp. NTK016B TaxID=2759676 RepID=UPI001A8E87AB|nr:hydrogenase expression/formation protein HupK [Rhodobacter sp. NTK016B]MBN8293745.1 hydrogenase expression/formation protein HupK [Rhodobacter sp. NTK016B]
MTAAAIPPAPLRAWIAPQLPVASLLVGQPVARAAMLLPRLFNLCQAAQAQAVAVALGAKAVPDLGAEILRDHLLKFFVTWPEHLGLGSRALPKDWTTDKGSVRRALLGASGEPATLDDFAGFLSSGRGVAPVLQAIENHFAPFEAVSGPLPFVTPQTLWRRIPVENSIATRHATSPILAGIEARRGRGPFWRAVARLLDLAAVLDAALPAPFSPEPGLAMVPASRGAYGLRLIVRDGIVAECERVTPTDSLLAPGGVLEQSLGSLDAAHAGLGPLLLDILDPCAPVTLEPTGQGAQAPGQSPEDGAAATRGLVLLRTEGAPFASAPRGAAVSDDDNSAATQTALASLPGSGLPGNLPEPTPRSAVPGELAHSSRLVAPSQHIEGQRISRSVPAVTEADDA